MQSPAGQKGSGWSKGPRLTWVQVRSGLVPLDTLPLWELL